MFTKTIDTNKYACYSGYRKRECTMKKLWTKYCGAIMLYSVIILGIFILNARFKYLEDLEMIEERGYNIVAIGD